MNANSHFPHDTKKRPLRLSPVLPLLCLLLLSCHDKAKAPAVPADTRIEWREKTWDFGEIAAGEEVTHLFRFKNTGARPLLIKKIETGCGCTTATPAREPVAPGKEGKIEISFNSAGRYGKQYKEIRIFANIPERQATLHFTVNVK